MPHPIKSKVKSVLSGWYLWFFPVAALLISSWLFYDHIKKQGPEIEINFDDAAGIQSEKTEIRFRGVAIGTIKKISISDDTKDVIVTAQLQSDAKNFAVEGSKFWIVMPKVNFQGVSGLETLIDGTYIGVIPGARGNQTKRKFKGQTVSESSDSLEDTSAYLLETTNLESVSVGDNVSFRGLNIGTVTKVFLSKTAQIVNVQINVQNKYVMLIRANTVFWRKTGVQANLGLFKSEIKINSLESLIRGGIDVFTPDPPGPIAKVRARFTLNASPPKDWQKWNPSLQPTHPE